MKTQLFIFCMVLLSWSSNAQGKTDQSAIFKNAKIAGSYVDYINLKDALVKSDFEEARKASESLQKSLAEISNGKSVLAEAAKITSAKDIQEQRKIFSDLTNVFLPIVKEGKTLDGILYLQHCPMANGGVGADWLSNEKEVKNPYFGDKMLTCGTSKEFK